MHSFIVAVCVYGPYALVSSLISVDCVELQSRMFLFELVCLAICIGSFYAVLFILSWIGTAKDHLKTRMLAGLRIGFMLACSISVGLHFWHAIHCRPAWAFWHTNDTHVKELFFQGDTWSFCKKQEWKGKDPIQDPEWVKEILQLDYPCGKQKTWQVHSTNKPTTCGASVHIRFGSGAI